MAEHDRGARVAWGGRTPTLNLPDLLNLLADAVRSTAPAQRALRLLSVGEGGSVTVNLAAALRRLAVAPGAANLARSADNGFLRDCPSPPARMLARVGAALPEGGELSLHGAVRKLVEAIDGEIETLAAEGADLRGLVQGDAGRLIADLADSLGAFLADHTETATRIGSAAFVSRDDRRRTEREGDIARVTLARETIELDREGIVDRFARSVGTLLANRGGDERLAHGIDSGIRDAARRPQSAVSALVSFCQYDAIARVRARVGYEIMAAVTKRARQRPAPGAPVRALSLYAARALRLLRDAVDEAGEGVRIAAAAHLGRDFDFQLEDYLARARFGQRLPVWPEWSDNLGEIEAEAGAPGAQRDLAYRFRINGDTPSAGERTSALAARVMEWREALADGRLRPDDLALIIFLAAVVPEDLPPPGGEDADGSDALGRAKVCASRIASGGKAAIARMLDDIVARDRIVTGIARALIDVLRSHGDNMLDEGASTSLALYVCMRRGVVEENRLFSRADDVIAQGSGGESQKAVFFENLDVSEAPMPGALFSFQVAVELFGRAVHASGKNGEIESRRDISGPCALVLMQPVAAEEDEGSTADFASARLLPCVRMEAWRRAPVLRLLYEARGICARHRLDEREAQRLLARQAAFAVLAAVCTRRLLDRAGVDGGTRVLMVRSAEAVGGDLVQAGEDVCYALSQAIELVLGRYWPLRVQGYEHREGEIQHRRLRGSLDALLGAFPVRQFGPRVSLPAERLALMTVVSRPCDAHPELVPPEQENHLLLGRIYQAERTATGGLAMRMLRGVAAVHRAVEAWERQIPVVEALERLHADGVRDVILLTHRFMGRQTGRSAPAHRHFETAGFQSAMAQRHPDLRLYRLVRHVFPALRLGTGRTRPQGPDIYEVAGYDEHHDRWIEFSSRSPEGAMHGLVPIYSIATMLVVGQDEERRPQSGFVTYSALLDRAALGPAAFAANAALIGSSPDGHALREGVISCLRALHYLEAERPARHRGYVQPVLDPYGWSSPAKREGIGEIDVRPANEGRRKGGVVLSIPALLERVMSVIDLLDAERRDRLAPRPGEPPSAAA